MADNDVNVVYSDAGLSRKGITAEVVTGDYDPGNLVEIDRAIRHAPWVLRRLKKSANDCLGLIEKSHDFHLIVSEGGESRARVYIAPAQRRRNPLGAGGFGAVEGSRVDGRAMTFPAVPRTGVPAGFIDPVVEPADIESLGLYYLTPYMGTTPIATRLPDPAKQADTINGFLRDRSWRRWRP